MKHAWKSRFLLAPTALAIALLATTTASASSTTIIKVTGSIVSARSNVSSDNNLTSASPGTGMPPACDMSLSNIGFDYGPIPASNLHQDKANSLGAKRETLTIDCLAPTRVGLKVDDNMTHTADGSQGVGRVLGLPPNYMFGLGKTSGTNLGAYTLTLMKEGLVIDSQTGRYISSTDTGKTWSSISGDQWLYDASHYPNSLTSWTVDDQDLPVAFKHLSAQIEVNAAIKPLAKLPPSREFRLDGITTFVLVYL